MKGDLIHSGNEHELQCCEQTADCSSQATFIEQCADRQLIKMSDMDLKVNKCKEVFPE